MKPLSIPFRKEANMRRCLFHSKILLLFSIQCFAVFAVLSADSAAADRERPNVIVIVSDDQGYGDVGFNGPCDIPTPNLDALAGSGHCVRVRVCITSVLQSQSCGTLDRSLSTAVWPRM